MSYQWLSMRITEENDRRKREEEILERLPRALEEVHQALAGCVENYQQAFGPEAAELQSLATRIRVTVREELDGRWEQRSRVEVVTDASLPGFKIDRGDGSQPLIIEVGMLPGDKLYFRDHDKDQYVTMEELTRRILDRALFPKLKE